MAVRPAGPEGFLNRWAELGQRRAVLALEWGQVAKPLLLLPFLLAIHRVLSERGWGDPASVAVGLGLLATALMTLSGLFHPTVTHNLAQAGLNADSEGEMAAIYAVLQGLLSWYKGIM